MFSKDGDFSYFELDGEGPDLPSAGYKLVVQIARVETHLLTCF